MGSDEVRQMTDLIHTKIQNHGWTVTGVFSAVGDLEIKCPHAYTIGLSNTGLPELIISGGFDPKTLQGFLNMAAKRHLKDEIRPGDTLDFLANVPFRAIEARVGDHIQQALNYYRDPYNEHGFVSLVQIIWPDRDGNFPDEPGWTGGEDTQELFV